jgi:RHS repeat-associated protein
VPYENRYINLPGGNESEPSATVTAVPQAPEIEVPAYHYRWTYDPNGNRLTKECPWGQSIFGEATYEYGPGNQLLVEHTSQGDFYYDYDASGNTLLRYRADSERAEQFIYGWHNRVVSLRTGSGDWYSYVFTPEEKRFSEVAPSGSERYMMYLRDDVITDYDITDDSTMLSRSYFLAGDFDNRIGHLDGFAASDESEWIYYATAADKTIACAMGEQGSRRWIGLKNAWGEVILERGIDPGRYRAMKQREAYEGTDIVYMRARNYMCRLGRFLSREPVTRLAPWSGYRYAESSPLVMADPTGLYTVEQIEQEAKKYPRLMASYNYLKSKGWKLKIDHMWWRNYSADDDNKLLIIDDDEEGLARSARWLEGAVKEALLERSKLRRLHIRDCVLKVAGQVRSSSITALEGMARIFEWAAWIFKDIRWLGNDDEETFMEDLVAIICGYKEGSILGIRMVQLSGEEAEVTVRDDVFGEYCTTGDTGFKACFRDGSNQVRHATMAIGVGAHYNSSLIAPLTAAAFTNDLERPADRRLWFAGASIGAGLSSFLSTVSLDNIGAVIREELGDPSQVKPWPRGRIAPDEGE